MANGIVKFSGTFTLQDMESDPVKEYSIPSQVLYENDHHVIVVYEFKKLVQPPWLEAIVTGIISHFGLDPNSTVALATECHLLAPGEEEPEGFSIYPIEYKWIDGQAKIIKNLKAYTEDD